MLVPVGALLVWGGVLLLGLPEALRADLLADAQAAGDPAYRLAGWPGLFVLAAFVAACLALGAGVTRTLRSPRAGWVAAALLALHGAARAGFLCGLGVPWLGVGCLGAAAMCFARRDRPGSPWTLAASGLALVACALAPLAWALLPALLLGERLARPAPSRGWTRALDAAALLCGGTCGALAAASRLPDPAWVAGWLGTPGARWLSRDGWHAADLVPLVALGACALAALLAVLARRFPRVGAGALALSLLWVGATNELRQVWRDPQGWVAAAARDTAHPAAWLALAQQPGAEPPAEAALRRAIQRDTASGYAEVARYTLARRLHARGERSAAHAQLRALTRGPHLRGGAREEFIGEALALEAGALALRVLEAVPRSERGRRWWRLRGEALLQEEASAEALSAFEEALLRDGRDEAAAEGLVAALLAEGQLERAAQALAQLSAPSTPRRLNLHAELHDRRGEDRRAIAFLQRSLALDDQQARQHERLAWLLIAGDASPAEPLRHLRRARDLRLEGSTPLIDLWIHKLSPGGGP